MNGLSVWEKGERVQQLPTIFGVRFPYNPIYLLRIHVRVCSYKTICEKKYEITACMINVWGYTKSYPKNCRIQPATRLWRLRVMCVRGPNNVGRAVKIYPTLLRFASAITEHKKFWELLA